MGGLHTGAEETTSELQVRIRVYALLSCYGAQSSIMARAQAGNTTEDNNAILDPATEELEEQDTRLHGPSSGYHSAPFHI